MDTMATDAAQMMGRPYRSISVQEENAALLMFGEGPLSGYLAGRERGGKQVCALEDAWCDTFGVKHAIACNSNTSGLLAAAFAAGLGPGDKFVCPAMTMTATAAAPMFTGATPQFYDVSDEDFCAWGDTGEKAAFVTNLFGHPAQLAAWRADCDASGSVVIEDNAQAPFAREGEAWAGTIGHIGVFSLNVHKHFHCGEGGVIVTNDDHLAWRMRGFINHGEHVMGPIGLNLRMPEICAAIALSQLRRGKQLVFNRIDQALHILDAIGEIPGIRRPVIREGCMHVFYIIPWLLDLRAGTADSDVNMFGIHADARAKFCKILREAGVPIVEGYQEPLYRMPAFQRYRPNGGCPVAEDLQDRRLFHIENCAYTFSKDEIHGIGDAFKRAAECLK